MRKQNKRSHGFTLVELLVVITIIGMLMGLLFPAVHAVLEAARSRRCLSQMREIGKAAMLYDAAISTLPAYHTTLGTAPNTSNVGWPVMLLPYMDRMDLWNMWSTALQNVNPSTGYPPIVSLSVYICPSDPPDTIRPGLDGPSSYIANGYVCSDDSGLPLSYVSGHDGAAQTLMISENLRTDTVSGRINAHNWWDGGHNFLQGTSVVGSACSVPTNTCDPPPLAVSFGCLNSCHPHDDAGIADSALYPVSMTTHTTSAGIQQGNISSAHGGGSNVIFCDGHGQFLSNNLDDNTGYDPKNPSTFGLKSTYELLVNPNDMGDVGSPLLDEAKYSHD